MIIVVLYIGFIFALKYTDVVSKLQMLFLIRTQIRYCLLWADAVF